MTARELPGTSAELDDLPFLLEGAFIAQRFGIPADQMRDLMSRRMVHGRVEKGEAEDAGHWRLTLRLGNRVWRGVFTNDGELCDETMGLAGRSNTTHRHHG